MRHATLLALALAAASCLDNGPIRCDDLVTSSCDRPAPPRDAVTLHRLRTLMPTRYPEGQPVEVRNVIVTAVDAYDEDMGGSVGNIWVQEVATDMAGAATPLCPEAPGGGRACGMQLFNSVLSPTGYRPRVGDIVDVSGGRYDEFRCEPCGGSTFPEPHFLPEVVEAVVRSAGVAPPLAPVPVTVQDLENDIDRYIGVLVEVRQVTVVRAADRRGEIQLGATSAGLKLTQELTPVADAPTGARFDRIVGIANYFFGPKLIPRSAADLERVP